MARRLAAIRQHAEKLARRRDKINRARERAATIKPEASQEPCKHGEHGPCPLCEQEDAEHDSYMANSARERVQEG